MMNIIDIEAFAKIALDVTSASCSVGVAELDKMGAREAAVWSGVSVFLLCKSLKC